MNGWSKRTYRLREIMEKTGNHVMYYLPVAGSKDPLDGSERAFVSEEFPGVGSMGKSMEFMGRPWFPHASHASLAFPCYAKAWKSMGSMGIFFRLHQQSMD